MHTEGIVATAQLLLRWDHYCNSVTEIRKLTVYVLGLDLSNRNTRTRRQTSKHGQTKTEMLSSTRQFAREELIKALLEVSTDSGNAPKPL